MSDDLLAAAHQRIERLEGLVERLFREIEGRFGVKLSRPEDTTPEPAAVPVETPPADAPDASAAAPVEAAPSTETDAAPSDPAPAEGAL